VELTACIALANFATRFNTALGIESQGYAAACDLVMAFRIDSGGHNLVINSS
jgi:hypothetical protein